MSAATLRRRLSRIEADRPRAPCPGCGFDGRTGKRPGLMRFIVSFGPPSTPRDPSQDNCAVCGRRVHMYCDATGTVDKLEPLP